MEVSHAMGGTSRVLEGFEKVDTTQDIVISFSPTAKRRFWDMTGTDGESSIVACRAMRG